MSFIALATGCYLNALAIDEHVVWFSDVILGGVQGVRPDDSISHGLVERHSIGGVLFTEDGSLLCSGPGWFDPTTGRSSTLLTRIGGALLSGVNETCPDGMGGLIFGTLNLAAIVKGEQPGPAALYRLDVHGKLSLLSDGLAFGNGLGVSVDGTTQDCDGTALDIWGNLWITGFSSEELLCLQPNGASTSASCCPRVRAPMCVSGARTDATCL